jgi:hypothetical protein
MTAMATSSLPVQRVSRRDGVIADTVVKVELAKKIGAHLRDLRVLDEIISGSDDSVPSSSSSGNRRNRVFASIKGVGHSIICCIENMKVIILRDEALVFAPESSMSKLFIKTIQSEFDTFSQLRFEHEVLETLINVAFISLSMEFNDLDEHLRVTRLSQENETSEIEFVKRQLEMFPKKTQLQFLRKRVIEAVRELCDLQGDDSHLFKLVIDAEPTPEITVPATNQKRTSVTIEGSPAPMLPLPTSSRRPVRPVGIDLSLANQTSVDEEQLQAGPTTSGSPRDAEEVDNRISVDTGTAKQSIPFSSNSPRQVPQHSPEYGGKVRVGGGQQGNMNGLISSGPSYDARASESFRPSNADGSLRPSISMRGAGGASTRAAGGMGHHMKRRKQSTVAFASRGTKELTFDIELILDNAIIRMCYLENEIDDLIERISAHEGKLPLTHVYVLAVSICKILGVSLSTDDYANLTSSGLKLSHVDECVWLKIPPRLLFIMLRPW